MQSNFNNKKQSIRQNLAKDPAYSTGTLAQLLSKFIKNPNLIGMSSNFLNKIKTCICIRKNYKNCKFSPSHFWQNLAKDPVL